MNFLTADQYFETIEFDNCITYEGLRDENGIEHDGYKILEIRKARIERLDTSARETAEFSGNDTEALELRSSLSSPGFDQADWMCSPIFRDVVVFLNSDSDVVDLLHICFECSAVCSENYGSILVTDTSYAFLAAWFKKLGHCIPNHSLELSSHSSFTSQSEN